MRAALVQVLDSDSDDQRPAPKPEASFWEHTSVELRFPLNAAVELLQSPDRQGWEISVDTGLGRANHATSRLAEHFHAGATIFRDSVVGRKAWQ